MDQMRIPKGWTMRPSNIFLWKHDRSWHQIQPMTLGQASRISGVNPADLAVLAMVIKQR